MSRKIIVSNISSTASEKSVMDFFLFCGKIKEFELIKNVSSDQQTAYIMFERDTAAKTALMLTNAVIGDSQIKVTLADDGSSSDEVSEHDGYLSQEDKPKAAIFAEILAAGFQLQDHIIERGLQFDAQYGLSNKFKQYLAQLQEQLKVLDDKYKVTELVTSKAVELDQKYHVQDSVKRVASQAQDKANSALSTLTGKRLADIYFSTTKVVSDVHCEARRIANLKRSLKVTEVAAH
ncbi:8448_t:CDS:2 [Paraglomus occultum]|uniref:8448_t:CDS:1 n=1 Tax=Paraglomus occultum TaxID=144539 RepID=A0A9N8Z2T6_9GLOM|nr:8448_t:CDS:2 [Paraglomus occultum]